MRQWVLIVDLRMRQWLQIVLLGAQGLKITIEYNYCTTPKSYSRLDVVYLPGPFGAIDASGGPRSGPIDI